MENLVNDINLGTVTRIDAQKKKDLYLFVHCRNNKSKVQILSIIEKFDYLIYVNITTHLELFDIILIKKRIY